MCVSFAWMGLESVWKCEEVCGSVWKVDLWRYVWEAVRRRAGAAGACGLATAHDGAAALLLALVTQCQRSIDTSCAALCASARGSLQPWQRT